jgi:hypothetical protein
VNIAYLPVLPILRDLYRQPRDMQRFQKYIASLTGGTDDVVLPIGVANPMAREHAVTRIDDLLALGADEIAAAATARADARLARIPLARRSVGELADEAHYPAVFACLYGDAAAVQLGYPPLGLPARAGFDVALADALDRRVDPVASLLAPLASFFLRGRRGAC